MHAGIVAAAAQAAQGGAPVTFLAEKYFINTNTTINAPCVFNNPVITLGAGISLSGIQNPYLQTEWFGAKGDGTTDDGAAFQAVITTCANCGYIPVQLLAKTYKVLRTLNMSGSTAQNSNTVPMYGTPGTNQSSTKLITSGLGVGVPLLKWRGGSGAISMAQVRDIWFVGDSNTIIANSSGFGGLKFVRCTFDTSAQGLLLSNDDAGSFTEFTSTEDCLFTATCVKPLHYTVTGGLSSFNGSGLGSRTLCNLASGGTLITIDSGCFVYQAPLDIQCWNAGPATLIANSSGTTPGCTFLGRITVEQTGLLTLASGNSVYFCGTMASNNENWTAGTLIQTAATQLNSNGSVTPLGMRRGYKLAVATGANILAVAIPTSTRFMNVLITGAGYTFEYVFVVGGGGGTTATQLAALQANNGAGYGGATFTVNGSGQLVATNAAFPASGLTAYYSEVQLNANVSNSFFGLI